MSDSKPDLEGASPTGSPIPNETRLEATNSQIVNASQVVNSPGAVVHQVHTEQSSATPGILAGMFGVLLLLLVGELPLLGKLVPTGLAVALVGVSFWLMVGGFFSWVESLLNQSTKSDVAGWLGGLTVGHKVEPWPETFAKVFDRVFGEKHLTARCLVRSAGASMILFALACLVAGKGAVLYDPQFIRNWNNIPITVDVNVDNVTLWLLLPLFLLVGIVGDYLALLETRVLIKMAQLDTMMIIVCLLADAEVTVFTAKAISTVNALIAADGHDAHTLGQFLYLLKLDLTQMRYLTPVPARNPIWYYPAFFTSIWLWLYAGSGFLLKFARRFDKSLGWFNRRFDIEKKPLQSIGLVAGALAALIYWRRSL